MFAWKEKKELKAEIGALEETRRILGEHIANIEGNDGEVACRLREVENVLGRARIALGSGQKEQMLGSIREIGALRAADGPVS